MGVKGEERAGDEGEGCVEDGVKRGGVGCRGRNAGSGERGKQGSGRKPLEAGRDFPERRAAPK